MTPARSATSLDVSSKWQRDADIGKVVEVDEFVAGIEKEAEEEGEADGEAKEIEEDAEEEEEEEEGGEGGEEGREE